MKPAFQFLCFFFLALLLLSGCGETKEDKQRRLQQQLTDAILHGHANNVREALESGANANLQDGGFTPLHLAILASAKTVYDGDPSVNLLGDAVVSAKTRVLVEAGANVNATDHEGRTPLDIAIKIEDDLGAKFSVVVNYLRSKGAKTSVTKVELNRLPASPTRR